MASDERKDFITQIVKNNFKKTGGLDIGNNSDVNSFLNNANSLTLVVFIDSSQKLRIDSIVSDLIFSFTLCIFAKKLT